jgi:hypothetical protein
MTQLYGLITVIALSKTLEHWDRKFNESPYLHSVALSKVRSCVTIAGILKLSQKSQL